MDGCDHDDVGSRVDPLYVAQDLQAVKLGHADIEQNHVGAQGLEELEGVDPVVHGEGLVAEPSQELPHVSAHALLVIDNKNPFHDVTPSW